MSATCRSCGAEIVWLVSTGGKPMPCNAETVRVLVSTGQVVKTAHGLTREVEVKTAWTAHWATCPSADQHRRAS